MAVLSSALLCVAVCLAQSGSGALMSPSRRFPFSRGTQGKDGASRAAHHHVTRAQPETRVRMQPEYMIRYEIDQGSGVTSTSEETIVIGFSTFIKKGILLQVTNDEGEYISVEMNLNGGVKVALDVGWEIGRDELNVDVHNIDLADGHEHLVTVKRSKGGRRMDVQIDDYPVVTKTWDYVDISEDMQLDNPKYIYLGRNQTDGGFRGCLFGARYDSIQPLQAVFQDPRPDNILLEPDTQAAWTKATKQQCEDRFV